MEVGRRQLVLAGLGLGLSALTGIRLLRARDTVVPGGGEIDRTAMLQRAADEAARSGTKLFLPAGTYATRRLRLKSGTCIEGVPGRTVFHYRGGGAILSLDGAAHVRLSGLVLDGGGVPLGPGGALLRAKDAKRLDIQDCRFIAGAEDGIVLRRVLGRIAGCEIGDVGKAGVLAEDCDLTVADCLIDKAAMGLSLVRGRATVRGNVIRNLRLRKTMALSGTGIAIAGRGTLRGNVIEHAPAYGILITETHTRGPRVTGNLIHDAKHEAVRTMNAKFVIAGLDSAIHSSGASTS
jgi:hypothetical protein